jgi:hypothetical protein
MEKIKNGKTGIIICMLSVFFLRALRYTKKLSFLRLHVWRAFAGSGF